MPTTIGTSQAELYVMCVVCTCRFYIRVMVLTGNKVIWLIWWGCVSFLEIQSKLVTRVFGASWDVHPFPLSYANSVDSELFLTFSIYLCDISTVLCVISPTFTPLISKRLPLSNSKYNPPSKFFLQCFVLALFGDFNRFLNRLLFAVK